MISLRHPAAVLMMRERFPDAAHVLWMHDLLVAGDAADAFLKHGRALAGTDTTIVCVSDFHLRQVAGALGTLLPDARFPLLRRVYNPIADDLLPDGAPVDPDKLVFFSSPHKGLEFALRAFGAMPAQLPSLRLYLANPGYFPLPEVAAAGVTVLGSLHHEMMAHVRGALATFLPNLVYPETFGWFSPRATPSACPCSRTRSVRRRKCCRTRHSSSRCRQAATRGCLRSIRSGSRHGERARARRTPGARRSE